MDILSQVSEFVDLQKKRGQLADTTFKSYGWHLNTFARWMCDRDIPNPSSLDIVAYWDYLQTPKEKGGRGFMPRSTRSAWVALNKWDAWVVDEKQLRDSIIPRKYPLPKIHMADVFACPANEQRKLAAKAMENTLETPWPPPAIVLAPCAVRNSSLRKLRLYDYDRAKRTLQVRGKGGKVGLWNLSIECYQAIETWMEHGPKDTVHNFLFCQNDQIRPLGDTGLKALLRDLSLAADLGYTKNHRPHALRRGCATRLVQEGENIDSVRELLDHKKLTTTQMYVRQTAQDLRASRDKYPLLPAPETKTTEAAPPVYDKDSQELAQMRAALDEKHADLDRQLAAIADALAKLAALQGQPPAAGYPLGAPPAAAAPPLPQTPAAPAVRNWHRMGRIGKRPSGPA